MMFLKLQRDHSKKRSEGHHFESNGCSGKTCFSSCMLQWLVGRSVVSFTFSNVFSAGLFGQHNSKKPKIIKHSADNSFDNITPMSGSIPSPVASQMSNMSNPNKIIRMIGVRDRGRKAKGLKVLIWPTWPYIYICMYVYGYVQLGLMLSNCSHFLWCTFFCT